MSSNETFFKGDRKSPWYLVAFGMVGASVSGVSFVSVPGTVNSLSMTYLQTCLGFIVGYFLVAFLLLPLYYKLNLTTIYGVLDQRLGRSAYKTGAWFFLISKMTGAVVRFYLACIILHKFVLAPLGIPFALTVLALILIIWLYTQRSGIKTLVWTDTIQTTIMLTTLCLIIYQAMQALGWNLSETISAIISDSRSRVFVFDDLLSKQYFWKQFLSGIFIVIVMTGLDQDSMQKNLTCKTLRDAQKDMCTYGFAFVPVNLLFLALGVLLSMLCELDGLPLPAGDQLLPTLVVNGRLGQWVIWLFAIGLTSASFSSADSALTSMTTSFCVDIANRNEVRFRKLVHIFMALSFGLLILVVNAVGSSSVIDTVYVLCSYTYGPLLGLFALALTKRNLSLKYCPIICVLSPVICYITDCYTRSQFNYAFGYELLLLNGALTYLGILMCSKLPARHSRLDK